MKRCTKCGVEKAESEFYKDKGGRDGLNSQCKVCYRARQQSYRERNPEKVKASAERYKASNGEKIRESERKSRLKRKDSIRAKRVEYEINNRDALTKRRRDYYAKMLEADPVKYYERTVRHYLRKRGFSNVSDEEVRQWSEASVIKREVKKLLSVIKEIQK